VENILARKAYPEQGFRSCMGIISLAKRYSQQRLETACQRALAIQGVSYRSIKSILEHKLDQRPLPSQMDCIPVAHDNIRGAEYYTNERNPHAHPADH
jgi:transposase